MSALPAPLTPTGCDLRPFRDMPLDIGRFRSSDLVTEEDPEAVLAAILIWGAAWHEVPAASVPENDRWLAKAAGYGRAVESWLRVRDAALRGFVKCSDGRLYHRTLSEKATSAWQGRLKYEWRKAGERHRKAQRDIPDARKTKFPEFEQWISAGTPSGSAGSEDLFRRNEGENTADFALKGMEGNGNEWSHESDANASGREREQPTVPADVMRHFREHRVKIKAAMTARAEELITAKLEKIRVLHGHDPTDVIAQSIECGWRGVFPLKDDQNGRDNRTGAGASGSGSGRDGFNRAADRRMGRP